MRAGLTLDLLHQSVGIHPTIAEDFTLANRPKLSDDEVPEKTAC